MWYVHMTHVPYCREYTLQVIIKFLQTRHTTVRYTSCAANTRIFLLRVVPAIARYAGTAVPKNAIAWTHV